MMETDGMGTPPAPSEPLPPVPLFGGRKERLRLAAAPQQPKWRRMGRSLSSATAAPPTAAPATPTSPTAATAATANEELVAPLPSHIQTHIHIGSSPLATTQKSLKSAKSAKSTRSALDDHLVISYIPPTNANDLQIALQITSPRLAAKASRRNSAIAKFSPSPLLSMSRHENLTLLQ